MYFYFVCFILSFMSPTSVYCSQNNIPIPSNNSSPILISLLASPLLTDITPPSSQEIEEKIATYLSYKFGPKSKEPQKYKDEYAIIQVEPKIRSDTEVEQLHEFKKLLILQALAMVQIHQIQKKEQKNDPTKDQHIAFPQHITETYMPIRKKTIGSRIFSCLCYEEEIPPKRSPERHAFFQTLAFTGLRDSCLEVYLAQHDLYYRCAIKMPLQNRGHSFYTSLAKPIFDSTESIITSPDGLVDNTMTINDFITKGREIAHIATYLLLRKIEQYFIHEKRRLYERSKHY